MKPSHPLAGSSTGEAHRAGMWPQRAFLFCPLQTKLKHDKALGTNLGETNMFQTRKTLTETETIKGLRYINWGQSKLYKAVKDVIQSIFVLNMFLIMDDIYLKKSKIRIVFHNMS